MELIAVCLGLSQVEIDRLKMQHPTSIRTVAYNILLMWKQKQGSTATLDKFEQALKDAEEDTGAHVDWDTFGKAKEKISKGK
jgi:hypothetical protein